PGDSSTARFFAAHRQIGDANPEETTGQNEQQAELPFQPPGPDDRRSGHVLLTRRQSASDCRTSRSHRFPRLTESAISPVDSPTCCAWQISEKSPPREDEKMN